MSEEVKSQRNWIWIAFALAMTWYPLSEAVGEPHPSDLTQDYLSAHALLLGHSIYEPLPASEACSWDNRIVLNDHPPPYILALSPLGFLPYRIAFLAMAMANIAAVLTACFLIAGEFGWSTRVGALVAMVSLLLPGTVSCVMVGNISLLLFLAIVLGWRALRRGRPITAGIWIGLAAAIKLYPGLLIVALVVRRDWRGLAAATLVGAGLWIGSALVVGCVDMEKFIRERAPANTRMHIGHGENLSMAGAVHQAFDRLGNDSPWLDRIAQRPDLADALTWAGRSVVVLLVAIGVFRARRGFNYADQVFAVLVPGMLLLSPLTWLHAVPMMILPVAVLARAEVGIRLIALIGCSAAVSLNRHWIAVQWVTLTGGSGPAERSLAMLVTTCGMVSVLLLAATARRTAA
jgi:hypothetical protein